MRDNKTIIITGANSGLGFECARNIAGSSPDHRVILACRNMAKAEQAKAKIVESSGNSDVHAMELDVSSLASVRAFVKRYNEDGYSSPYGLVCNAGIMGANVGLTPEGFDLVFATNHLGHFLLTNLLLPFMLPTGRVVMVSSDMHSPPGPKLVWPGVDALAHPDKKLSGNRNRYSYSKLCNLYFTYELCARLKRTKSTITVNAFNPGLMTDTNFAPDKSRFTPIFLKMVSDRVGSLVKSGAALAELLTEPQYGHISGKYYDRSTEERQSSPLSYDEENALELWNMSAGYTKLKQDETLPDLLLDLIRLRNMVLI